MTPDLETRLSLLAERALLAESVGAREAATKARVEWRELRERMTAKQPVRLVYVAPAIERSEEMPL